MQRIEWILLAFAFAAIPLSARVASAAPRSTPEAQSTALSIARQGYFFVGGHYVPAGNDEAMADQMFVQFQVPSMQTRPYPVVMIHGGNQSGTNFLGTPDGRPGWNDWFLRHGYAVYIVDQAARGRSAYNPAAQGPESVPPVHWSERIFTSPEKFGLWSQAKLHTQWPGTGQEGNPIFDQFFASQEPSITDNTLMDEANRDDLITLLQRIGPAVLLTHSRSGPFGWLVADAHPDLVKAIVAIEPSGPPFYDVPPLATKEVLARPWGLAYAKLHFDPPVDQPDAAALMLVAGSGGPDTDHCWEMSGPPRTLPALQQMPILIVTSEASHHTRYDHCTVGFLEQNGVHPDHIGLGDVGIHGNGHMMMLEKNNQDIANVLTGWLARHAL